MSETTNNKQNLIKKFSLFDSSKENRALLETAVCEVIDHVAFDEKDDDTMASTKHEKSIVDQQPKMENLSLNDKFSCASCNISAFASRDEQIEHFKGDLHLFNLKQKLKGKPVVSAEEFEKLTDISSISGSDSDEPNRFLSSSSSDSESESEYDLKSSKKNKKLAKNLSILKPKLIFKLNDSNVLVMFRCALLGKKENVEIQSETIINRLKLVSTNDKWCIILVAAGHFAAAIFKGEQVIAHKTFHRYVVRAKRGTVQSQHDSSGKHARSAGANIRRHHEAAFKDDIRSLIGVEWKSEIDQCKCIFIRVPQYNRNILISSNQSVAGAAASSSATTPVAVFDKNDTRLRNIPFMTFRPTFNEVKRTHTMLSRVELHTSGYLEYLRSFDSKKNVETAATTISKAKKSPQQKPAQLKPITKPTQVSDNESEEENSDDDDDDEFDTRPQLIPNPPKENTDEPKKEDFIQSLTGDNLKLFNEIYTACVTNNPTRLKQLFDDRIHSNTNKISTEETSLMVESLLNKRLNKENGFCILHLTSQLGHHECVQQLLQNGANPTLNDMTRQKRLPYFLASNKQTRDQFRRFMNDYPNRWDYSKAAITCPLSEEKLNEKLQKEREKKKEKRKIRKKRENEQKQREKKLEDEQLERKMFLSLTDQQKRLLIVDRNFLNMVPLNHKPDPEVDAASNAETIPKKSIKIISRCWYCGEDMSTHVPFEYFDYKFCSTKCLRLHRTSNTPTPASIK